MEKEQLKKDMQNLLRDLTKLSARVVRIMEKAKTKPVEVFDDREDVTVFSTMRIANRDLVKDVCKGSDDVPVQDIYDAYEKKGISKADCDADLEKLKRVGDLFESSPGVFQWL